MLFIREFVVRKHERGLLYRKGDFERFLAPGIYRFFDLRKHVAVERFDASVPAFEHRLADFFVKAYADEVKELFKVIETGINEVAVIYKNGRFADVLGPDRRALYWKGVVETTAEIVDITEDFEVATRIAKALSPRRWSLTPRVSGCRSRITRSTHAKFRPVTSVCSMSMPSWYVN